CFFIPIDSAPISSRLPYTTLFRSTWDGKMRPCGLMTYPEVNILEEGFETAWRQIHTMTKEIRLPKECSNCENKKICRVCAAMCQDRKSTRLNSSHVSISYAVFCLK